MKIAILGSHGTGKTTLTRQLYNYLRDAKNDINQNMGNFKWRYLPESPVQALMAGFDLNEQTSLESELWIIAKQLEMEILTPSPWIADKCLIDILAYACYLFPKEKSLLNVTAKLVKKNINYDLIIYLPSGEFPIEDDSFRSTDINFQKKIDEYIIKIMKMLNVRFHRITGSPEERLYLSKKLIKEKYESCNFSRR